MKEIYPVEGNGFYLTFIDEDFKSIRCNKNYQNRFANGLIYRYKISKHNETDIEVYVVYTNNEIPEAQSYFTKKSLSEYFDTKAIFREEKLNILGI
jgi:hypothetical protein